MKKILILEDNMWGHHLEYMSHLFHNVPKDGSCQLIYVVPKHFEEVRSLIFDEECPMVTIDYMSESEYLSYHEMNYIKASLNKCRVLKKYASKHNVDECFLIKLVSYLPFLPFFIPKQCKLSGIIYRIYYYAWHELDYVHKMKDIFQFWLLSASKRIKNIYLLNSTAAATYSNHLYNCSKFKYLPDPINVEDLKFTDLHEELNISAQDRVFLHFGSLTRRKGTLTILEALLLLTPEQLKNKVFVFSGKVHADIKTDFYRLCDEVRKKGVHLIIIDKFCSYEYLYNLINISDAILTPYANVAFSSGALGYAAKFNVPVIGPRRGLLGNLIKKHHLGITLREITPTSICEAINMEDLPKCCGEAYAEKNSIRSFASIIFHDLLTK